MQRKHPDPTGLPATDAEPEGSGGPHGGFVADDSPVLEQDLVTPTPDALADTDL